MQGECILELFSALGTVLSDGGVRAKAVSCVGGEDRVQQGRCDRWRTAQRSLWELCGTAGDGCRDQRRDGHKGSKTGDLCGI